MTLTTTPQTLALKAPPPTSPRTIGEKNRRANRNQRLLLTHIQQRAQQLWGQHVHVTHYEPLSERLSSVARIGLSSANGPDTNSPATLIVKHLPLANYPASCTAELTQELREEHVCYTFLHQVRDQFPLFAHCYAFDNRGFLLLEDLQPEPQPATEEHLMVLAERLANTLARLHLATFNKRSDYQHLRQHADLPTPGQDPRAYSLAAHRRRYRLGAATLKDYCSILGVALPASFNAHIDLIETEMENPGQFHCFVHDDLANARQVIARHHAFYLIDFENAKYSHALLDLCKPLAGKFEMLIDSGEFFYANPNFPQAFIAIYRRTLAQAGRSYPDDLWDAALTHAVLYHGVALVGKLIEISADRRLRKPFAFDLQTIIGRHLQLVDPLFTYSPITDVLQHLWLRLNQQPLTAEPTPAFL
ncbi:MAG: phosphotransferase [Gammaproteobacteria bacterium]